jgi:hypothetical protein
LGFLPERATAASSAIARWGWLPLLDAMIEVMTRAAFLERFRARPPSKR